MLQRTRLLLSTRFDLHDPNNTFGCWLQEELIADGRAERGRKEERVKESESERERVEAILTLTTLKYHQVLELRVFFSVFCHRIAFFLFE